MSAVHVKMKIVTFAATVGAIGTHVTLLSSVDAAVFAQGAAILGAERAVGTSVGSLPSVRADMFLEIVCVAADVPTVRAAVPLRFPICL